MKAARIIGAIVLIVILIWCAIYALLIWGPASQSYLIRKYESANLAALNAADLQTMTNFPMTDITYMDPYRPIPGFKAPWTPGFFLSLLRISNGPLEGQPMQKGVHGVKLTNGYMIATHEWFNARDWGLYYSDDHTPLPTPYWSKHIVGNWQVWYFHYSSNPEKPGMWYK